MQNDAGRWKVGHKVEYVEGGGRVTSVCLIYVLLCYVPGIYKWQATANMSVPTNP